MHEFIGRWFGWVRALFGARPPFGRHDGVEAPPCVSASPQPVRRGSVRTATVLDGEAHELVRPYLGALTDEVGAGRIARADEAATALVYPSMLAFPVGGSPLRSSPVIASPLSEGVAR